MTMKKVVLVLLGISIVCNLVLAGIAITNYAAPNEYVDTAEKACVLGKAYLDLNFPDFDVYNSRYDYFAVYYPDDEYWSVVMVDKIEEISRDLPCVTLSKDGAFINAALQPD